MKLGTQLDPTQPNLAVRNGAEHVAKSWTGVQGFGVRCSVLSIWDLERTPMVNKSSPGRSCKRFSRGRESQRDQAIRSSC